MHRVRRASVEVSVLRNVGTATQTGQTSEPAQNLQGNCFFYKKINRLHD